MRSNTANTQSQKDKKKSGAKKPTFCKPFILTNECSVVFAHAPVVGNVCLCLSSLITQLKRHDQQKLISAFSLDSEKRLSILLSEQIKDNNNSLVDCIIQVEQSISIAFPVNLVVHQIITMLALSLKTLYKLDQLLPVTGISLFHEENYTICISIDNQI